MLAQLDQTYNDIHRANPTLVIYAHVGFMLQTIDLELLDFIRKLITTTGLRTSHGNSLHTHIHDHDNSMHRPHMQATLFMYTTVKV